MSGRRWPRLAGILIAGAAVGAIGARALRRRQQQWEEYDPGLAMARQEGIEPMISSGPTAAMPGSPIPATTTGPQTARGTATVGTDKLTSLPGSATDAVTQAARSAAGKSMPTP